MSMQFSYGNTNTVGQHLYAPAVCPTFGVNYNHYFAPFCANSNGLLPTPPRPLMLPFNEQNKNVNIRECKPLMGKNERNPNDFLTFIEQKNQPLSGLNPFANEFSIPKANKQNPMMINTNYENMSSYRLIFDHLIEQSLQSIEAIKKASKPVSVNHISTQCDQSIDIINRSTQTHENNFLEEHSSRTVDLMNKLLENFKDLKNDSHNQLKSMSNILDELHYLILTINQILTTNKYSIKQNNLFSNMIKDHSIQSSPIIADIDGDACRLISHSPTPSVFSRQIHPITMDRSKICLLCQKPVDDNDNDVMHKFCRLFSSPLNV